METWLLVREDDGTYTLFAPNGVELFTVSLKTLLTLGDMFLTEGEDEHADESINEVL